jgi:invasion protein IalB
MRDFVFVGRFGLIAAACGIAALLALPAAAAEKPAAGAPATDDSGGAAPVVKPAPKPVAKPAAAAPPAAAGAPDSAATAWVKLCDTDPNTKKELCIVTQELHANSGQFIASATIRHVTGEDKISLIAAVPPGMQLPPGLRVQIDSGKQYPIAYQLCLPNACYGELPIDDDFIKTLRSGKQLIVMAMSQRGQGVPFPMSLAGFTKSYDSKGLDAKAAQQRSDDLNKALQARAEEARKKLIEQQQKESGGAAPAQ